MSIFRKFPNTKRGPSPRSAAWLELPRSRVVFTPGRRLSSSAMVTSGSWPICWLEMLSEMTSVLRFICSALRRLARMPVMTIALLSWVSAV